MRLFAKDNRSYDEVYGAFRWNVPRDFNIGVEICDKHSDRAQQTALFLENSAGEETRLSFGELKSLSNRLANALRDAGVGKGDRVGIVLPQRAETVIAHIAVYKLGAIALPLSVLFGRDALSYRLSNSGAKVVITDAGRATTIASIRDEAPALETVLVCRDGPDHRTAKGGPGGPPRSAGQPDGIRAVPELLPAARRSHVDAGGLGVDRRPS